MAKDLRVSESPVWLRCVTYLCFLPTSSVPDQVTKQCGFDMLLICVSSPPLSIEGVDIKTRWGAHWTKNLKVLFPFLRIKRYWIELRRIFSRKKKYALVAELLTWLNSNQTEFTVGSTQSKVLGKLLIVKKISIGHLLSMCYFFPDPSY